MAESKSRRDTSVVPRYVRVRDETRFDRAGLPDRERDSLFLPSLEYIVAALAGGGRKNALIYLRPAGGGMTAKKRRCGLINVNTIDAEERG